MRLALDTNCYTALAAGDVGVVELVSLAEAVFLPFVVVAELRAGFACGTLARANEIAFQRFLTKPGVEVLFADDATIRQYANLYRQLRQQGTPVPVHDLWIAALTLQHDLTLCTRDGHFRHLPQLRLL